MSHETSAMTPIAVEVKEVKTVCAGCGRVRLPEKDPFEQSSWVQLDIDTRTDTINRLSHGLCPECMRRYYPDYSIVPRE